MQVIELARAGTRVAQLAATFGISEATIYNWLKQEQIDRGEIDGFSTDQALEPAGREAPDPPARDRARSLAQGQRGLPRAGSPQKALPGDRFPDRAGSQRPPRLADTRRLGVWLLRLDGSARPTENPAANLAGRRDRRRHKAFGGTYGAMRVTAELLHSREITVGHNAVASIMAELGIKGLATRRVPKGARVGAVSSLDLVRRRFRRDGPDQLWMTDITEHPTREGKLYCCVVLDAFSRLVVGWSIDATQTTVLVTNALGMATSRRARKDGLVIHSDRGVQPGRAREPPRARPHARGGGCASARRGCARARARRARGSVCGWV